MAIGSFSVIRQKGESQNGETLFQENEARQIVQKINISYPLICTHTYQGVRNARFSENLTCFVFLKHAF